MLFAFQVVILEIEGNECVGIGVVNKDYDTSMMPGWDIGSVGYHTDDGKIFQETGKAGKETIGIRG